MKVAKHKKTHPWKSRRFGAAERVRDTKPVPELFVEIVDSSTDAVVKRLGPFGSENLTEKADRGVNVNLDHARFYTRTTA